MSDREAVDQELVATVEHLSNVHLGLSEARKDYQTSAVQLGEVLLRHKLTVEPHVALVGGNYERGIGHLQAALSIFKEKVIPALNESGIKDTTARGENVYDYVESVGPFYDDVLKKVVQDLFKDEIFDKQKNALNTATGSIGDMHSSIQEGILGEGNPLDETITNTSTCIQAVNDYRQFGL